MKSLVIVSNTSWNLYNFRLELMEALKTSGFDVVAVAPKDEYSDKLVKKGFKYREIKMNNKGTSPFEDFKLMIDFYKLYKEIKPDIVLNYTIKPNIYGSIVCGKLNIPAINNISGLGTVFIKENFVTSIVKFLYGFSQKYAKKVFFQNKDDYDLLVNEYGLINKDICEVIPGSGIDIEKFKYMEKEKNDNVFRFLLIARMLYDKGINEFVEAIKMIKKEYPNRELEFQLLGAMGVENKTAISKEQIEEWEKQNLVKYLGKTDDVRKFIKEADCIVLPSYREGLPRTLLEAASMEKIIVATDVAGCRDVVDDSVNGYLCEVKNAESLANAMKKVLNLSPERLISMGKRGREKIMNEYQIEIVIKKYLDAIKNILKSDFN